MGSRIDSGKKKLYYKIIYEEAFFLTIISIECLLRRVRVGFFFRITIERAMTPTTCSSREQR